MRISIFFFIIPFAFIQFKSQEVFTDSIKSIQLFNPKTNNQSPFVKMDETFLLSFDVTGYTQQIFTYEIIHCDYDWRKSNLPRNLYTKGLRRIKFPPPQNSFNTLVDYLHYEVAFPTVNNQLLISGNYIIEVYKGFSREPEFSRKFVVYENNSNIKLEWFRNLNDPQKNQRIAADVSSTIFKEGIATTEYKFALLKNNRFETQIDNVLPSFYNGDKFRYESFDLSFEGGNEYFTFDTKLINVTNFFVEKIERNNFGTDVFLRLQKRLFDDDYVFIRDINGQFFINSTIIGNLNTDPSIRSDYTRVHFTLNYPNVEEDIYVLGGFNNWDPTEEHKMMYNENDEIWEASIWLKQGYYNYQYAIMDADKKFDAKKIHGNHWQTENKYTALFYQKPMGQRYYRVIGISDIHTP